MASYCFDVKWTSDGHIRDHWWRDQHFGATNFSMLPKADHFAFEYDFSITTDIDDSDVAFCQCMWPMLSLLIRVLLLPDWSCSM